MVIASACQVPPTTPPPPAAPPATTLWDAAAAGDIGTLEAHIAAGANLNALQPRVGTTALVVATAGGQGSAVDWLLANGADVSARSGDGNNALHGAAFVGNANIAATLLEAGIDVSATNDAGQTVWQTLAMDWQTTSDVADLYQLALDRRDVEAGRAAIGELLAPHLDRLSAQDIWVAVVTGNADAVRSHLDAGEDVGQRDNSGATLLIVAAIFGEVDVAAVLLAADAEVNARHQQNGSTALHAAAFLGRGDVVQLLLDAGADAALMSDDGGTALAAARLDWATTQSIATMLQVPVSEASVMAGKAATVGLLHAELGQ